MPEEIPPYKSEDLQKLQAHYAKLRDKASYDAFIKSAHALVSKLGIDPSLFRMALRVKKSMMEFGVRQAYRIEELNDGIRVGFLMNPADVQKVPPSLAPTLHEFLPAGQATLVKFTVSDWNAIPPALHALNEMAMQAELGRVEGTKYADIRKDSATTNEALKYAVAQGLTIEQLTMKNDESATEGVEGKGFNMRTTPLNQIFYGPPGTGKTYHTVNAAVEICDPEFYAKHKDDRDQIRRRFEELKVKDWNSSQGQGQIGFCTFHQSFSYEDFIEGIKPSKPREQDEFLKYEVRPGILRQMADLARFHDSGEAAKVKTLLSLTEAEMDKAKFFKLSLGDSNEPDEQMIYEHCIENDVIAIGFMGSHDLTGLSEQQIKDVPREKDETSYASLAMSYFCHSLKKGDYVIVTNGNYRVRAIGRVTGDYMYEPDSPIGYPHFRTVQWLVKNKEIPHSEIYERQFSQQTIYKLDSKFIKRAFFTQGANANPQVPRRFVLIIDEINRGNVAAVFGELITLIEDNKRAGAPEALEVTLPYSQETFSIPSNLYLIGTMNTADRSVEALDTALRRRFSFVRMAPEPDKIKPLQKTKIDLSRLLSSINERLVQLLDEDHQIGHSHFWHLHLEDNSLEALRMVFANDIIPQLEEYFHRDRGRLWMVLGSPFVQKVSPDDKLFPKGFLADMDFEPKDIYRITPSDQWTEDAFVAIHG